MSRRWNRRAIDLLPLFESADSVETSDAINVAELSAKLSLADIVQLDCCGRRNVIWKRPLSEIASRQPPYRVEVLTLHAAGKAQAGRIREIVHGLQRGEPLGRNQQRGRG